MPGDLTVLDLRPLLFLKPQFLAVGNRTGETARKFGLCEGRISQVRKELAESWRTFVGEEPDARTAGLATA